MNPACLALRLRGVPREVLAEAMLTVLLQHYASDVVSLRPPAVRRAVRAVCGWGDTGRLRVVMAALRRAMRRFGITSVDGGQTAYRREDLQRLKAHLIRLTLAGPPQPR